MLRLLFLVLRLCYKCLNNTPRILTFPRKIPLDRYQYIYQPVTYFVSFQRYPIFFSTFWTYTESHGRCELSAWHLVPLGVPDQRVQKPKDYYLSGLQRNVG